MQGNRILPPHNTHNTRHTTVSTVLAFDFGQRRIGVAVGDAALGIAHPLIVIEAGPGAEPWAQVAELVAEWRPSIFVVGMPGHDDGRVHPLGAAVRRFSRQLAARFGLPVHMVDERLTSFEAATRLRDAGIRGRAQKPHLDAFAASAILQAYFESERTRA